MTTQTDLFNRRSGHVSRSSFGDRYVMSSTTWMLRHALMADFKVRAACKNLEFRRLRIWNKRRERECPVKAYSRKNQHQFPSDSFPTDWNDYYVTGDDGTTWEIGSLGNDIDTLVQEVVNNPYLWPKEKEELVEYLRGPRKIPSRHTTPKEDPYHLHQRVDGYFCNRIINGEPVTEDEIRESGLPDETVENLIHNLRVQREHHARNRE